MKTLADRFRRHAAMMPAGLYRCLMFAFADDFEAGGVVVEICRDWADAPTSAIVQLRLLGGIQRLVLAGRAPQLVRYYPNLGGDAPPEQAWADFEPVLRAHAEELRAALEIAPQTNEPGRAVPLLVGLFDAVRRSGLATVRLLEVGASAGLNLLVDRFRISGQGWSYGPADSPLRLPDAVLGAVAPVEFRLVSRRGCDLAPIDARSADGRLRLTSFVWPHDLHRYQRLQAALAIAADCPVTVDRAPAGEWLAGQLATAPGDGVLTAVWHSITRQYWPGQEVAAVDAVLAEAGRRMPIAHIAMESPVLASDPASDMRGYRPPQLTVRLAVPGGTTDREPVLLGTVADHGVPVTLLDT
ncbi:MAG TPA: DUF2332 domain-containing protein [Jatrophihabitans sp.]|nr:DUF2332 domain-containing protein [Jatrophihabitans sp.]